MPTFRSFPCFVLLVLLGISGVLSAAEPVAPPPPEAKAFLILMRLTPKYHEGEAWTDADDAVVRSHFTRLQEAAGRGQVILAGRTTEPLDRTMGLVVFTAPDEAAAREFMTQDPCVVAGIMTATLHPYSLAILGKPLAKK